MSENGSRRPTQTKILLVDDLAANLRMLRDTLASEDYEIFIASSGAAALKVVAGTPIDLILLDIVMPDMDGYEVCRRLKEDPSTRHIPVIFVTAQGEMEYLVDGFRAGGVDYITKPFAKEEVLMRAATHLSNGRLTRALQEKNEVLEQEIARRQEAEQQSARAVDALQQADGQLELLSRQEASRWGIDAFIGQSPTIQHLLGGVRRLQSASNTSVLITGESGTGKELIARAIHFGGTRTQGPFIALNCSALSGELAESTLFGHVRGAFTGAHVNRKGSFELANGGTLFLDEIGDMPPGLQPKLLRVLEEGLVVPLGSESERSVDVRVIAATNADLPGRINSGAFRSDLYFRLARFLVDLPPLRQRREDIALLAQHFVELFAAEMGFPQSALTDETLGVLRAHDFPGNVRELKNIIERALIESGGAPIQAQHLHFIAAARFAVPAAAAPDQEGAGLVAPIAVGDTNLTSTLKARETETRILEYVRAQGSINNEECRALLEAEYHHVSYFLRKMARRGTLVRTGERRWARYRLP